MAQLWQIRDLQGNLITPGDWVGGSEPLYSTVEIGAGPQTVLQAFSYGRGGVVPGSPALRPSNLRDTNLEGEGGRLPENEELVIFNMAIEFYHIGLANATDAVCGFNVPNPDPPAVSLLNMLRLQRDLYVELRISTSTRIFARAPASYFPASTGVTMWNSGARAEAGAVPLGWIAGNNGMPDSCGVREFASPHYVAGGETFGVDFRFGPGEVEDLDLAQGAVIRAVTYLDGYHRRPVR